MRLKVDQLIWVVVFVLATEIVELLNFLTDPEPYPRPNVLAGTWIAGKTASTLISILAFRGRVLTGPRDPPQD